MPEKTDQVQSSLALCVGHYLGPLQLSPLSRLFNLLLVVFSKAEDLLNIVRPVVVFSKAITLPVGMYGI